MKVMLGLAVVALLAVPAASGQMQLVDMGLLVSSYPLASGGAAIVVLSDNAAPRLFLDYVPGDGQPAYRDGDVSLMEKLPDKIITSASGPYVHITLNWTSGVKAPVVCHYRWTLPYGDRVAAGGYAVNQVFMPLLESP